MSTIQHIGVFTSGGDAPGMNAAIRAVVRSSIFQNLPVSGIFSGFDGMIKDQIKELSSRSVSNIIQRGGTVLGSARSAAFLTKEGRSTAFENLRSKGIDALVGIGGDGTFAGLQVFNEEHGIPVIGITGTIDNDLYGTDRTIGYDTALNTVVEAIDRIRDTASSHDRLFFIEVMGKDAGGIALNAALAAGAEYAMIPERDQGITELVQKLKAGENEKSSSIVIVAEGDEEGGAYEVARKVKARYDHYDTRVTVLGHTQRGGSPSAVDRIFASRSGIAAVDALLAGESNQMVGTKDNMIGLTPLEKAIGLTRDIDSDLLRAMAILSI
jgi:6-phosphofructokinase 1